jgi:hypothetical protein
MSSSVARKLVTSVCGRLRMKPTAPAWPRWSTYDVPRELHKYEDRPFRMILAKLVRRRFFAAATRLRLAAKV